MSYSNIVCLDDLLREEFWPAKNFFYDLIREPISQACGIDIRSSPRHHAKNNLADSFDLEYFFQLCDKNESTAWEFFYHRIPFVAETYLIKSIPLNSLVISYEMPPWLRKTLSAAKIDFLDIRISPLRFARDLYIAIYTNNLVLQTNLSKFTVPREEIKLEASLVLASVKHLRRYKTTKYSLDTAIVYIGQTENDASLISEDGHFLRINHFKEELKSIIRNKKVLYKPHPSAIAFSILEKESLEKILNQTIELCDDSIYELLGSDDSVEFVGLSSGSLQEAALFRKKAHTLYKPICIVDENSNNFHPQIRFEDFISPFFWHQLICPEAPLPKVLKLPNITQNQLRHLHNVWWGYSEYSIKDKHFWIESFNFSGGNELRNQINDLNSTLAPYKKIIKIIRSLIKFGGKLV